MITFIYFFIIDLESCCRKINDWLKAVNSTNQPANYNNSRVNPGVKKLVNKVVCALTFGSNDIKEDIDMLGYFWRTLYLYLSFLYV